MQPIATQQTVTFALELELITCATCGMPFAIPIRWLLERQGDDQRFCCPSGHELGFDGAKGRYETVCTQRDNLASERDKIAAQLQAAAKQRDTAFAEAQKLRDTIIQQAEREAKLKEEKLELLDVRNALLDRLKSIGNAINVSTTPTAAPSETPEPPAKKRGRQKS